MKVNIKRPDGPPDEVFDVETLSILVVGQATVYPDTQPDLIVVVPKARGIRGIQTAAIIIEDSNA